MEKFELSAEKNLASNSKQGKRFLRNTPNVHKLKSAHQKTAAQLSHTTQSHLCLKLNVHNLEFVDQKSLEVEALLLRRTDF